METNRALIQTMGQKEIDAIKAWREMRKTREKRLLNHPEAVRRASEELQRCVNDYTALVRYVLLGTVHQVLSDWEDKTIAEIEEASPLNAMPVGMN